MTIGQYIKLLFEQKDISLTVLAQKMGLKSRSTLYRLFKDYYSEEKTKELIKNIEEYVYFSDDERSKINDLMKSERISGFFRKTRKVLSLLYEDEIPTGYVYRIKNKMLSLKEIFDNCSDGDIKIFVANIDDERIIGDLIRFIQGRKNVTVYNFLRFANHRVQTAYEILGLISMWKYDNYVPVVRDTACLKGIQIIDHSDGEFRYKALMIDNDCSNYVDTPITEELYNYIWDNTKQTVENSDTLKRPVHRVQEYVNVTKETAECCKSSTFYSEGALCMGNLPFETLYEMFRDVNYFGYPYEHPYVQNLIAMYKEKEEIFLNDKNRKRYFMFDREHTEYMMRTGISFDHIDIFKPMSIENTKRCFEGLFTYAAEDTDILRIRFTKQNRIRMPFVFDKDGFLMLYSSSSDNKGAFFTILKKTGVSNIMSDFVDYVWDTMTYSEEESLQIMKDMMNEYIYK